MLYERLEMGIDRCLAVNASTVKAHLTAIPAMKAALKRGSLDIAVRSDAQVRKRHVSTAQYLQSARAWPADGSVHPCHAGESQRISVYCRHALRRRSRQCDRRGRLRGADGPGV